MGRYRRADRIASQIHQILAEAIRLEIRDPRVTPISITAVEVSGDLSHAQIRFLPLGGDGDVQTIQAGLRASAGFLKRQIARQLRIRTIPTLHFSADVHHDTAVELIHRLIAQEEE